MRIPLKPIKYKGKKYYGSVPGSWEDLSIRQYFEVVQCQADILSSNDNHTVRLYSILTGIPYDALYMCSDNSVVVSIESFIGFLAKDKLHIDKAPLFIKIRGKMHAVPSDLRIKPIGLMLSMESMFEEIKKIEDNMEREIKMCCMACALVMVDSVDGTFDADKAEALAKELEEYPVTDVLSTSLFFYRCMKRSKSSGITGLAGLLDRLKPTKLQLQ